MKTVWSSVIMGVALLAGGPSAVPAAPAPDSAPGTVYVIPIKDVIDSALLYVIRRGLQEAEDASASAIVFDMDTPGGRVDSAEEILAMLRELKVPTYTLVNPNAISAGAIIAMATDHIYMTPGSKIGDAMPIMISVFGDVQPMPESIEEKQVSYVAALIRAAAQQKGHDPQLAEAMVRRDSEYKIGDDVISKKGRLLTLTNKDAERRVGPEQRPLLSEGTVADVDELLKAIGKEGNRRVMLQVTTAEEIARVIESLSVIILALGLLGLYIEFKTPGFGLPGILGITLLAIWFWGHHIAGLAGFEEVGLFLLGLGFILVEIFIIPGFGWTGLIGLALVAISLLMAMVDYYPGEPWYPVLPKFQIPLIKFCLATALSVGGLVIVGRFLPRSHLFQTLVLQAAAAREEGFVASPDSKNMLGRRGVAQTALRPAGIAVFDGARVNVVTRGDFLNAGENVVVVEAHGNHMVVERISA